MNSNVPAAIGTNLGSVGFWDDGRLVLTASDLTGRYWNGSLCCFSSVEDAPNIEKCFAGIETEFGIGDACCLNQNQVVVGMDSGAVELFQLDESDSPHFDTMSHSLEHDDVVSSLSLNCNNSKLISAGYDKCIKVWELEAFRSVATYRPVHSGVIWQVACSEVEPEILLSCGQDGKIFLLDLRLPKPATALCPGPLDSVPTAVAWKPQSEFIYAVGDDNGHVTMRDIRNFSIASFYQAHHRQIYRLSFSKTNPNWLASCADTEKVLVTDVSKDNPTVKYCNASHSDYVRGLAWSPDNCLISCGWDKKVFKHVLNGTRMDSANESFASANNIAPDDSV